MRFRSRAEGPHTTPQRLIADKAIRPNLCSCGIGCTIPERADQSAGRKRPGRNGGRPPVFDPTLYKRRNLVERCINRLKQWRGIATRDDKPPLSGSHSP
ncbi:hypothetical protein [Actinomadura litoris]|uniref:hypothetical protein n=1 Tax=Actinomadura litoris TaxID=2678616 RepID=UPI001FA6DAA0|nr:hypothetical protein [Actinomadura litoris]